MMHNEIETESCTEGKRSSSRLHAMAMAPACSQAEYDLIAELRMQSLLQCERSAII
jgi:hypothetical protein